MSLRVGAISAELALCLALIPASIGSHVPDMLVTGVPVSGHDPSLTATDQSLHEQEHVPFTGRRGMLLAARDNPSLFAGRTLIDATQDQIAFEQRQWTRLSRILEPRGPGAWALRQFVQDAEKPSMIYEWQMMIAQRPTWAESELMRLFLEPEAKVNGVSDVFMFSRSSVEGRDVRFAAEELLSVYQRHLELAVRHAHTRFVVSLQMPDYEYDFQKRAARFPLRPDRYRANDKPGPPDEFELMSPISDADARLNLPSATTDTANYSLTVLGLNSRDLRPSEQYSPAHHWSRQVVLGSSDDSLSPSLFLALDRRVRIGPVSLSLEDAEALAKMSEPPKFGGRLFFTADQVIPSAMRMSGRPVRYSVLFARLDRLEVLHPDGRVLASYGPGDLPIPTR